MKKYFVHSALICSFIAAALFGGCGSGPGAPGSSGSENTGIEIQHVSLSAVSTDIDVNQTPNACPASAPTGPEPGLTKEDATMTIDASALNSQSSFDPFPANVNVCTVTYLKANENPDAPTITSETIYPNCGLITGSNTCTVILIDIPRKTQFWSDIVSGRNRPPLPAHYVATYSCSYVNPVGKSGQFTGSLDIRLDDFLICTR